MTRLILALALLGCSTPPTTSPTDPLPCVPRCQHQRYLATRTCCGYGAHWLVSADFCPVHDAANVVDFCPQHNWFTGDCENCRRMLALPVIDKES